jgi:hypothetical protein
MGTVTISRREWDGADKKGGYTGTHVATASPSSPTARQATFSLPSIRRQKHILDRFHQVDRSVGVTENSMIDATVQGFHDRGWRAEIHIGEPERDDVLPPVLVPLLARCITPVYNNVEIKKIDASHGGSA